MFTDPTGQTLLAIGLILLGTTIVGGAVGGWVAYDSGHTGWDAAKDVIVGAAMGLAIGGAGVCVVSVGIGAVGFLSNASVGVPTLFGVSVVRTFAVGALAFDFTAWFVAPAFGFSMEGIEYEPMQPKMPNVSPSVPHPAVKRHRIK